MSRSVAAEAAKETDRDRPKNGTRSRYLSFVVVSYFAVVFSLICISSFLQKSPTVDEPIHLFSGYSYLKWGDFRANPEHPPFAKMWAALPLLLFDIKDSVQGNPLWELIPESSIPYPTQDLSRDLLAIENDGETLFFYAKLQMIALGILLGAFVYLWSKELFGIEAAVAALFIFVLDPNILAHSQIVHTDLPFTAFFFIATYFFRRALGRLTWADFILTCLFFALAAITKYSYPVILLAWFMLGLAKILSTEPYRCAIGMPETIVWMEWTRRSAPQAWMFSIWQLRNR